MSATLNPFSTSTGSAATGASDEVTAPFSTLLPGRLPRVNLLPPEILATRRLRRAQRGLAASLVVVVLGVGGAWALAQQGGSAAQAATAAQQARAVGLHADQVKYASVTQVSGQIDRLRTARAQAMAADVRWYELIDAINASAPQGVWLTSLSVTLSPTAVASAQPDEATDPLADPALAVVSVEGFGGSAADVASFLQSLTAIPGLHDARYSMSSRAAIGDTVVQSFSATVGVSSAGLSHRYDDGEE